MFNLSDSLIGNVIQIIIVTVISFFYVRILLKRECKWAYIIAYAIRIALLLFSVYGRNIGMLPFDGGDTEFFYGAVLQKTDHIEFGIDALVTVTTYVSYVLGDSRFIYQYIMLAISMLGLRLTDRVMRELNICKSVREKCLFIAAVFPSFAMFGIIYSREAIVSTGSMASFLFFILFLKEKTTKRFIYLLLCFCIDLVVCIFHAAPAAVVAGFILAIMLYDYHSDKVRVGIKSAGCAVAICIILCAIYIRFPSAFEKLGNIKDVSSIAGRFMYETNIAAGSSYAQYVGDSDTWGRLFFFTPVRMFYGMFAPFPWEWRGLSDMATFFGNSVFYIVVSVIAIFDVFRKKYWRIFNKWLVLTLMFASAMVGWGSVAFGTAIRHRDKFFLLFVVLMSLELRGKDKDLYIENPDN